jgi:hypothetical protein
MLCKTQIDREQAGNHYKSGTHWNYGTNEITAES